MGAEACARNTSAFLLHLKEGVKNNFAVGCHTVAFQKLFSIPRLNEHSAKCFYHAHRAHRGCSSSAAQAKDAKVRTFCPA